MSFLDEIKRQASQLQSLHTEQHRGIEANTLQTEAACKVAWQYLRELAQQLNVLQPAGPKLSVDGKTPWPAMALVGFGSDARKKILRNKEVFDYVAMAWDIVPQQDAPTRAVVSANFPPDLQRIEKRLHIGAVQHERKDVRHPENNKLLAYSFEYVTQSRGYVHIAPDHDRGVLMFRLTNLNGFDMHTCEWPASKVNVPLLDELAKLLVQQPSRFL